MKPLIASTAFAVLAIAISVTTPAAAATHRLPMHRVHIRIADPDLSFRVELTKTSNLNVIRVEIENPSGERLYVRLTDPEGNALDNFSVAKNVYKTTRPYNFSSLAPEGIYTLVVSEGNRKVKKLIRLQRTMMLVEKLSVE